MLSSSGGDVRGWLERERSYSEAWLETVSRVRDVTGGRDGEGYAPRRAATMRGALGRHGGQQRGIPDSSRGRASWQASN
jgi:hypothetical protein